MIRPAGARGALFAAATLLAAIAGCTASIGGPTTSDAGPPVPPDDPSRPMITGMTPTVETLGTICATSNVAPPLLRRLGAREYVATVRAAFEPLIGAELDLGAMVKISDDTLSGLRLGNDASVLLVGTQTAKEVMASAEAIASAAATDLLPVLLPCAASNPDEACVQTLFGTLGRGLLRRPLTSDETARYLATFRSVAGRSDFATGVKWMLTALLQSPAMLYRSEIGSPTGATYKLSPSEIASALAYDFSGGPPSAELAARASSGALADPAQRVAEARALLATPGGRQVLQQLFRQWALYPRVITETRGADGWTSIRQAMSDETQRFIDEVVVNRGGGVKELLTAPVTVVSPALASFYGYGANAGGDWATVTRPPEAGVGLLAQGSILAGNAHPDSSSPTLRGLLVYERLLCNARPLPPPVVPAIETASPGASTTRQRYEQAHAAAGACQTCHQHFDPIGFAFEHFDQTGRYRADEAGLAIDATGTVPGAAGGAVFSFDGISDLAQKLAALPQVSSCLGGFAEAFVFGGGGGQSCLAAAERQALVQGRTGILDFLAGLAGASSFVERRGR